MKMVLIEFDQDEDPFLILVRISKKEYDLIREVLDKDFFFDHVGIIKLSINDAAILTKWAGALSPARSPDYSAKSEIYNCLAGKFFNRYYDDGVKSFLNGEGVSE